MICFWVRTIKSGYKAECLSKKGEHVNTFKEDLKSLLDENVIPELELLKLMQNSYPKVLKTAWWIRSKDLLKVLFKKVVLQKKRYDIDIDLDLD